MSYLSIAAAHCLLLLRKAFHCVQNDQCEQAKYTAVATQAKAANGLQHPSVTSARRATRPPSGYRLFIKQRIPELRKPDVTPPPPPPPSPSAQSLRRTAEQV